MEGIETAILTAFRSVMSDVSRCPDMEGIETYLYLPFFSYSIMSVGAPTWRGLKPPQCRKP